MNALDSRALIAEVLSGIAPEADLATVAADDDLRLQLDLDSMDFLNLMVGLHELTGIDIPEADYPLLFTLTGMIAYLDRNRDIAR
jgi:acyl carrier protein